MAARMRWISKATIPLQHAGLVCLVVYFASPSSAFAQFVNLETFTVSPAMDLDQVNRVARQQLMQADEFLTLSRWDEAITIYRRVMDNFGTKMILLDRLDDLPVKDYQQYVSVRDFCHRRIVALADTFPEALQLYRRRVDLHARYVYERGREHRDEEMLEQVVDQFFASSYGDDALHALGEMALERGDFAGARGYWQQIDPTLRTPQGLPIAIALRGSWVWKERWPATRRWLTQPRLHRSWLAYPDSDLNLNTVRAHLVLASIMERSHERAELELSLLTRVSPEVEGNFDGRSVALAGILESMQRESKSWPPASKHHPWNTFAGSPARNGINTEELDIVPRAVWSRHIGPSHFVERREFGSNFSPWQGSGDRARDRFAYYPIIVGDILLVNDSDHIWAFNVSTGAAAFSRPGVRPGDPTYGQINESAFVRSPGIRSTSRSWSIPRFTMTSYGDSLYCRLGSTMTTRIGGNRLDDSQDDTSFLVGLDLKKQGKVIGDLIQDEDRDFLFEGSPVTDGHSLYVAQRRTDTVSAHAYVTAFDPQTGARRWRQWIVSAETPGHGAVQGVTNNLLAFGNGMIYYNTNLGVVAATNTRKGEIRWLVKYPRIKQGHFDDPPAHLYREMNPCLLYKDLIIAAPSDCAKLFALDVMTGKLIWENGIPQDMVHLLGVVDDQLVASGEKLWWLDVYSGEVIRRFPPAGATSAARSGPSPHGAGRGLISNKFVWWPTLDGIYLFDVQTSQHTGTIRFRSQRDAGAIAGGNLLIAHDHLIVATEDRLIAFNEYGHKTK